jgi:methyl-accepting chemotaxis protein
MNRRLSYFSLKRLSGKNFVAFLALAGLVLLNGIITIWLLSQQDAKSRQNVTLQAQYSDAILFLAFVREQSEYIDNIATRQSVNLIPSFERQRILHTDKIEQMEQHFRDTDTEGKTLFDKALADYRVMQSDFARIIAAPIGIAEPIYNSTTNNRATLVESVSILLDNRQVAFRNSSEEIISFSNFTRWVNFIVMLSSFALAIFLALIVTRRVARILDRIVANLRRVAAGDLSQHFEVRGTAEVAETAIMFNRTVANLKMAISRIQTQAGNVAVASKQISLSSDNQAASLSEQAANIAQVTVTAEELSKTSEQITGSASTVTESAENTLESAQNAYQTILGAGEVMDEIRFKVNQIADRILTVNSLSQRIRETTNLIDSISNETHLLALNAAIESAGAGEDGQRFAVVASNIRRLAQRSRTAAVDIQQLVNQIQAATQASVMATEEGMKVSNVGTTMLAHSLDANTDIIRLAEQTNQLANAISLATEQQRYASSQVAESMRQAAEIIQALSYSSQQFRQSANELNNVVAQLNSLANGFIIEAPGNGAKPVPKPRPNKPKTVEVKNQTSPSR